MREAAAWCRARRGPALVHAQVIRPYSHSLSDDESLYRSPAERAGGRPPRPAAALPDASCVEEGVATRGRAGRAARGGGPRGRRAPPTLPWPRRRPTPTSATALRLLARRRPDLGRVRDASRSPPAIPKTMVDLLNACLHDEMARDPRIVVFGEDVADCSREESLPAVKGKGGVFKVTHNLQRKFGSRPGLQLAAGRGQHRRPRASAWPPAGSSRWSRSSSSTTSGRRTCRSATSWRSSAGARTAPSTCPVVIRVTYGGYLQGGAIYHSQCGEVLFTHIPGLRVVIPSNAQDANGLLRTAIRCDDPVLFLEHKHLYRQTYNKGAVPRARLHDPVRQGGRACARARDVTIVTFGALVQRSLVAARQAEADGHPDRGPRPALARALRLGRDRARACSKTGKALVVARGQPVVGLRRGDRGPHRRRAVRAPRRARCGASAPSTPSSATTPSWRTRSSPGAWRRSLAGAMRDAQAAY